MNPPKQKSNPEGCNYTWYYRDDGIYSFHDENKFTTGDVKSSKAIKFGVFNCEWSVNQDSKGFVYFEQNHEVNKDKKLWLGVVLNPDVRSLDSNLSSLSLINENTPTIDLRIKTE